jgi:hypothetical protein
VVSAWPVLVMAATGFASQVAAFQLLVVLLRGLLLLAVAE